MKPLLCLQLALLITSSAFRIAAAKELEGERAAASTTCPSPEEAQKKMTVPDGYQVRCWAHEPLVVNPVAMTWDARGRLWVVEAFEYPEGTPLPENKRPFGGEAKDDQYHPVPPNCIPTRNREPGTANLPKDRVVILEDTDNDGEADKRTVFVEGLNLASAIICGDDGIYVGQQPHLIHFKDSNHDDKPDEWRVVLTGFGREDTHELVNSFIWGPDGWLYMTHGVFTNSKVRRPGVPENEGFKFDAGIGRARPRSRDIPVPSQKTGDKNVAAPWEFEVFADGTSNPWGCDYDAAGNFFVSACVIDHFFHMAPGGIYVRQGGAPENPYSYELLPSIVKHKHFRAAYAGVQIYQGGVYPQDTWGHAFIGNIHDNAIHEEVLTPVGATFKCEPRRDFLRANDGWFRPVSTQTGPDGNLWIMDWCDKYPCYQNAKANPEGVDRERGRIWRVVSTQAGSVVPALAGQSSVPNAPPKGGTTQHASRSSTDLDLKKLSTADLVNTLEHPNNWMRRMARRMLVERNTPESAETLSQLALTGTQHRSRMEAVWSLIGLSAHDPYKSKFFSKLAMDKAPSMRAWAARGLGNSGPSDVAVPEWLAELGKDKEPSVQAAVAIAARQISSLPLTVDRIDVATSDPLPVIQNIAIAHPEANERLAFSVWMALEHQLAVNSVRSIAWLANLAPATQPLSRVLSHKAMRRLCDTRKAENLDLAVEFCEKIELHDILLSHALDGLVKGQEGGVIKPTRDVSAQLDRWRHHKRIDVGNSAQTLAVLWGDEAAVKAMIVALHDATKPEKERIAVLQSLRKVRTDAVKEGMKPLLIPGTSTTLGVAAIRAAADLGGDDYIAPLLVQAASKDFNIRIAALEALGSRETWTKALLEAISQEKVPASGFPAPVRRALATSKDKAIRDLAYRVLGAWQDSSEDVKSLIAQKKQASLTGEPDLANGKLIFTATCMACHEFHGGGQKVGPDLIGSGRSNLDALLANVIDPNQIIGNGYENFTVSTKDGRTLAGRVVEDAPGHVKLLGAGGAAQVVPRDQVASLTNTKQSLMPMGFGTLPDAAFRDMIWYILAPPEEGPLTPEKKKLLMQGVEVPETAPKPKGTNWRAIDWESVSLWNPQWKVTAPDFERTPVKLAEYHGKTNVLLMHPFADKKTPTVIERKQMIEAGKTKLRFSVAADDRGDWRLIVTVNGEPVKQMTIDHEKPRWKDIEIDLAKWADKEATIRLEGHPTGWSWEFGYWHGIEIK